MTASTDLRLAISRELHTDDLSLEHDTMVVSPECSRRVIAALEYLSTPAGEAPVKPVDLRAPAGC